MNDEPDPLRLHAYSGRENGLMVVGTASSLRVLAQKLLSAAASQSAVSTEAWPAEVATPDVVGPYKDLSRFHAVIPLARFSSVLGPAAVTDLSSPNGIRFIIGALQWGVVQHASACES